MVCAPAFPEVKMSQPNREESHGPAPLEDTPAIARAREYGIDITLLEAMLDRTVEERLRMLDANLRFIRALHASRGIAS